MDSSLQQFLPQFGEHEAHQMIPFRLHIPERAADEDADGLPVCNHLTSSLFLSWL
jgi:hypothetical protein